MASTRLRGSTPDHTSIGIGFGTGHNAPVLKYLTSSSGTTFLVDTIVALGAFWLLHEPDHLHDNGKDQGDNIIGGTFIAGIRISAAAASPATAMVMAVHSRMTDRNMRSMMANVWVYLVPACAGLMLRAGPSLIGGDKFHYSSVGAAIEQVGAGFALPIILGMTMIPWGWLITWVGQACVVVGLCDGLAQYMWITLIIPRPALLAPHCSWLRPFMRPAALLFLRAAALALAYLSGLFKSTFYLTAHLGLFHGY